MNNELATERVWAVLASILDPEFGINIVDLGLIYDVTVTDAAVQIAMTLTSPACPAGAMIQGGVEAALRELPGVASVRVTMVWDPAWTPEMLTPAAREFFNAAP